MGKKTLLPANTTLHQRAMEQAAKRISDVPVPIRDVWSPDSCPVELLPWLAWALSLDTWSDTWPEAVQRNQIRQAVRIHRRKGTSQSVREVVSSFGAGLALQEWWQKDPIGVPYTFDIILTVGAGVPATAKYQEDIIDEVRRTRPRRSRFTFIAGVSAEGSMGLLGVLRVAVFHRLQLQEAPSTGGLGFQGVARPATFIRISTTEA
ncbi:phage tail protein I [Natronospirillum operosum]|nr:phage tail protein I [Natronospirillum operosum]